MGVELDWHSARALLEWQVELGASDAILADPVDRFARIDAGRSAPDPVTADLPQTDEASPIRGAGPDPSVVATRAAEAAPTLDALAEALATFPHCELRKGARTCVFADGNPKARVMIVGEGPGAEEDRQGKPFVGRSGQLLDLMYAAIGLDRTSPDSQNALYITNTVPWHPPANRDPTREELAMLRPFLLRHIALADPDFLVLTGNIACDVLLGKRGIMKLRGTWTEAAGRPALPMLHPAYLLRKPEHKREAWADLLSLKARLQDLG